jgi:hypothetical protein
LDHQYIQYEEYDDENIVECDTGDEDAGLAKMVHEVRFTFFKFGMLIHPQGMTGMTLLAQSTTDHAKIPSRCVPGLHQYTHRELLSADFLTLTVLAYLGVLRPILL